MKVSVLLSVKGDLKQKEKSLRTQRASVDSSLKDTFYNLHFTLSYHFPNVRLIRRILYNTK